MICPGLQHVILIDDAVAGDMYVPGVTVKMSKTPGRVRMLAPMPGEHNDDVFVGMLGHSREDLERWRADGVI